MSQNKRADKKSKWLRLAVGATLLAGASGAVVPGMAGATEANVNAMDGNNGFYAQLGEKVNIPRGGWEEKWYFTWGDTSTDNVVNFSGFTPDGYDLRFGGGFGNGTAVKNNQVNILNSTLRGVVVGGYTAAADEVSGNVVTLGKGTKVADGATLQVFGGYAATETDTIADNTVNILTAIELDALKGGENKNYSAGQNGNTLNIAAKNVKTNWFGSFENVNFFLPSDIADGDTMLSVNNGGNATDLGGVKVGVTAQSGVNLAKGSTVNLLVNTNGISNAPTALTAIENKHIQMVTPNNLLTDKEYTFGLGATETALTAEVIDVKAVTGEENGGGSDEEVKAPANESNNNNQSGSGNSSADVADEPATEVNEDPVQDDGGDTPAANPGNAQQSIDANAGVENLQKALTNVGIPAENIHEYHEDVAGALDPNQGDSVAEKGVILTGGTIDGDVYAGHSIAAQGKAEKNAVVMTGGTINGTLYGGHSDNGESANNSVELAGGTVKQIIGGGSNVGDNNKVTISAGDVKENVYGGNAVESASGNTVTMTGGTVNGSIHGGYTTGVNGKADNNTVTVSGGTVGGSIYGGYSEQGTVSGNTVNVIGNVSFNGSWPKIIGGFSALKDAAITDNTVNLINVSGMSLGNLQGGAVEYVENGVTMYDGSGNVSGNTINFVASKNISAKYFSGFSTANFYLPKDIANGDTVLTVSEGDVKLDGMNVGVAAPYGLDNLQEKDKVTLIKSGADKLTGTATKATAPLDNTKVSLQTAGNLVADKQYDFSLSTTSDALVATLDSVSENAGSGVNNLPGTSSSDAEVIKKSERLKSLVETPAANATLLNSGTDMLTGAGFTQAKVAADKAGDGKFSPFAAIGGSSLRAESGSYVDIKGHGVNVGFAREVKKGSKTYLIAPVVEYGRGNYDSHQDNGIKASGKSSFYGAGLMARQTNSRGVYYEGSLRGGRVKSDYKGWLSAATHASYDSDSNYWAAHVGWGRITPVKGNNSLDTYVKYFYSHQDGDEVNVKIDGAAPDQITFEGVESQRLRVGARLTHQVNENSKIFGGLAYQCETKGEARANYHGNETAAPSVKGSSGMLELGWQIKPGKSPIAIDLGVTGWAGKQRGVVGNVGFKYNF